MQTHKKRSTMVFLWLVVHTGNGFADNITTCGALHSCAPDRDVLE